MLTPKARTAGHYEARKMPWGTDYVWVPADEEVDASLVEQVLHPWHETHVEWVEEDRAHPELHDRIELEAL